MTKNYLHVVNDGQLIVSTNYWTSDYALNGVLFFSVNEGCVRLLLPNTVSQVLGDDVLTAATYVIISRGMLFGKEGYEVLFEDGSDSPFAIHTLVNQWDRVIPVVESGRTDIKFAVYSQGLLVRTMAARFRVVRRLPYLKPWDERTYAMGHS